MKLKRYASILTDSEYVAAAYVLAHKAGGIYARSKLYRGLHLGCYHEVKGIAAHEMRKAVKFACATSNPACELQIIGIAFREGVLEEENRRRYKL